MLLFSFFFILNYVAEKIYGNKSNWQIERDFTNFKLSITKDECILNAIESLNPNVKMDLLRTANISEFIEISEKYRLPIQRLLYEWNYVPMQDSSMHILNVLNNDCIQEFLRKFTDTSDYLSAAETCQLFQANALQCYPSNFERLCLSVENESDAKYPVLPLRHASNFLKLFGHLICFLELMSYFEVGTINMIAKNCSETLTAMTIRGHENIRDNFQSFKHFKVLKFLDICSITMDNVELPENLQWIIFSNIKVQENFQCIMKQFPKLKSVNFQYIDISDTALNAFIMLNPQIEIINLFQCPNISHSAIDIISNCLSNLMELAIDLRDITLTIDEYKEMVMHWGQLQQLKILSLHFKFDYIYPLDILINWLVTNAPAIETLELYMLHNNFKKAVPGLLQLFQLKILCLYSIRNDNDSDIVELVKAAPALEQIRYWCNSISISDIINILKYNNGHLIKLKISISKIDIDLSDYNMILAMIKEHLEVEIAIFKGNIDENIFEQNMQQLKVVRKQ